MSNAADDESDVVLSDVEEDDNPLAPSIIDSSPEFEISAEKFRELLTELDREKNLRIAVENSKSELQVSFNRLKALVHEAIKKRDECARLRDEAIKEKDEALRAVEKVSNELDEVSKAKELSRSEIETAAQMLVIGIEKISGKLNHGKNFTVGGLPRSQKYTGLPAVAYGVIKRTNEIVDEMLKQVDSSVKERDEAREQIDQRNYEIAIEVSQLEARIIGLNDEVSEKSGRIENLEKSVQEKERELLEVKNEMSEYECRIRDLESKMEGQRPLLVEQLSIVSKIHDQLYRVIKIVDVNDLDHMGLSESLFVPREMGLEENIRASLAGLESVFELSRIVIEKTSDIVDEKSREVKSLNETVARLVREKDHVGVLLRSALSKRLSSNSLSQTNEVFQVVKNGLKEDGVEFKFQDFMENESIGAIISIEGPQWAKDDEVYALAGALENIIKESQLRIIELQHSVDELRAESSLIKEHLDTQSKELNQRKLRVEELEEKERQANENIEGLMMDIAAAEEEINRWKLAAEQEAAAGRAVEQEYLTQTSSLKQEVKETKQAMIDLEKKLKLKEETAVAAMAAREAAEKSLRLADIRASRLRDRVEELTHQLESLGSKDESGNKTRARYVCWPWEWLGIDFVGHRRIQEPQPQDLNEMELSEPLL